MPQKQYRPEEIIEKLREAEVLLNKGINVEEVCRKIEVTKMTSYRWRREYNNVRPHSALLYRPPAPEAFEPLPVGPAPLNPQVADAA